jgi:hypothetical protein
VANGDHLAKVRSGSNVWNRWRADHPEVRPSLEGADLRGLDLARADFQRVNLFEADLREANLAEADLRQAVLCRAKLAGANLRSAHLWGADLTDADLRGANLREASLHGASLRRTDFRNAIIVGVKLEEADQAEALWKGAMTEEVGASSAMVDEMVPNIEQLGRCDPLVSFDGFARLELRLREGLPTRVFVEILGAIDRLHRELTDLDTFRPSIGENGPRPAGSRPDSGIWS